MKINTVCGEIDSDVAGLLLPHEHIFVDLSDFSLDISDEKLTAQNRYKIFTDPYALRDNAIMNSYEAAKYDLALFKNCGGGTIVDVTLKDIGRNVLKLKALSKDSGVHIVAGCGYYLDVMHSKDLNNFTVDKIACEIVKELHVGIDDTGIKAGVIGEIGTGDIITAKEEKSLQGAAIACGHTNKALQIHTSLWEDTALQAINIAIAAGAPRNRICVNHLDVRLKEQYIFEILDQGVYIEFDNFGKEYWAGKNSKVLRGAFKTDRQRVALIKKIIDSGYANQLLFSNDICLKSMLAYYGGNGYCHIINNVVPMLIDLGIDNNVINKIIIENALNFIGGKNI